MNPQRTPVFTTVIVILSVLFFGWLVNKSYHPTPKGFATVTADPADFSEDQRWKLTAEGRAQHLTEMQQKEEVEATTYSWVDQPAGVVHIPIDRAIELTAHDLLLKKNNERHGNKPACGTAKD